MAHGPCHCLPLCTHQIVPRFTRPLIEFSCALNTANFTQDHRTANCVRCDGRFHFGKRFPGSCPLWCSGCTTASDRDGEQRPRDQDQDEDEDEAARCGDVYKMTNCADIATCWLSAHAATLLTEEGRGGVSRGAFQAEIVFQFWTRGAHRPSFRSVCACSLVGLHLGLELEPSRGCISSQRQESLAMAAAWQHENPEK